MSNSNGRRFGIGRGSEQLYNDELFKLYETMRHILDIPSGASDPGAAEIDGALWVDRNAGELKQYNKSSNQWQGLYAKKFQLIDEIVNDQVPNNPVRGQLWLYNDVLLYWNGAKWTPVQSISKDGSQFALSLFENFTLASPLAMRQNLIVEDNQLDKFELYLKTACNAYVDNYEHEFDKNHQAIKIPNLNDFKLSGQVQCLIPNVKNDRIFLNEKLDEQYSKTSSTCITYDRDVIGDKALSLVHVNPAHLSGIAKRLFKVGKYNPAVYAPTANTEFYGFVSGSPYGSFLRPNSGAKEDGDYQDVHDHIFLNDAAAETYNYVLAVKYEFSSYKSSGVMSHNNNEESTTDFYAEKSAAPSEVFVEGFALSDYDFTLNDHTSILSLNENVSNLDIQMVHSNKIEHGFIKSIENHIVTKNNLHDETVPCGIIQLGHVYNTPLVLVAGVALHDIFGDYKYDRDQNRIYVNAAEKGMDWCVIELYDRGRDYDMFLSAGTVKDTDNVGNAVIDYNPDKTLGEKDSLQLFVDGELVMDSDIRRKYSDREFIITKSPNALSLEDQYMLFSNDEWEKHKVERALPCIDPDGKAYISIGDSKNAEIVTQIKPSNTIYTRIDESISDAEADKGVISKYQEDTEDPLFEEYASPKLESGKRERKTVKSVDGIKAIIKGDVAGLSYTTCYLPTAYTKRGYITDTNFRGEPVIRYQKKNGGNLLLFVDGMLIQKDETEYKNVNEAEIKLLTDAPHKYTALIDYTRAEKIVKLGGDPMNVTNDVLEKLNEWTYSKKSGTIDVKNALPNGMNTIPLKTGELDEDHPENYYIVLDDNIILDENNFKMAIAYENVFTAPDLKEGQKYVVKHLPSFKKSSSSGDFLSIRDVDGRLIVPIAYEDEKHDFLLFIDGILIDEDDVKCITPYEKQVSSSMFVRNLRYFAVYEKNLGKRYGHVQRYDSNGHPCIEIPRDVLFDDADTKHAYDAYLFVNDKLIPASQINETVANTRAYVSDSFVSGNKAKFFTSKDIRIIYGYISGGTGATNLRLETNEKVALFADGRLVKQSDVRITSHQVYISNTSAKEYAAIIGESLEYETGTAFNDGQIQTVHDSDYLSHCILFIEGKQTDFTIDTNGIILTEVKEKQEYSLIYEPSLVISSTDIEADDEGRANARFYGRIPTSLEEKTAVFSDGSICHVYIRNAIDDSKISVLTPNLQYGDEYIICSKGYYRGHSGVIAREKDGVPYFSQEVIDCKDDDPIVFVADQRIAADYLSYQLYPITGKRYFYLDNAVEGQSCDVVSYENNAGINRIHKLAENDGFVYLGTTDRPTMVFVDGIIIDDADYSMDGSKLNIVNLRKGSGVDAIITIDNEASVEGTADIPAGTDHPVIHYADKFDEAKAADSIVFVDGIITDVTTEKIDLPDQHRIISEAFSSGNKYDIIEKSKIKVVTGEFKTFGDVSIKVDIPQIDSANPHDNDLDVSKIAVYLDQIRDRAISLQYNQNAQYITAYGLSSGMEYVLFEDRNLKVASGTSTVSPDGRYPSINVGMTLSSEEKKNLMIFVEGFKVDDDTIEEIAPGIYAAPGLKLGQKYSVVTNGSASIWNGTIDDEPYDEIDGDKYYGVDIESVVSMDGAEKNVELIVDGILISKFANPGKDADDENYIRSKDKENGIYLEKFYPDDNEWKQLYEGSIGYAPYKEYYLFDEKALNEYRQEVDHEQFLRDPLTGDASVQPAIPYDSKKLPKDNISLILNGRRLRNTHSRVYGRLASGGSILLHESVSNDIQYMKANNMSVTTNGLKLGQEYILLRDKYNNFLPQNNFTPALNIGSIDESLAYMNNKLIGNNSIVDTYSSVGTTHGDTNEIKKFYSDNSPTGTLKIYSDAAEDWSDITDDQTLEDVENIVGSYVNTTRSVKVLLPKTIEDKTDIFAYHFATSADDKVIINRIVVTEPTKDFDVPVEDKYKSDIGALSVWVDGIRQYDVTEYESGKKFSLKEPVTGVVSYTVESPSYGNDYVAKREILTYENAIKGTTNTYRTKQPLYPGRIVVYVNGLRQPQDSFKILDNNTIVFDDDKVQLVGNQYNYPVEKMSNGKNVVNIEHTNADVILIENRPNTARKENTFRLNQTSTNFRVSISEYDLPQGIVDTNEELLIFIDGAFLGISENHGYEKDYDNKQIVFSDNDIIADLVSDPLYSYLILHPDKMNAYKKAYGETRKPEVKTVTIDWN